MATWQAGGPLHLPFFLPKRTALGNRDSYTRRDGSSRYCESPSANELRLQRCFPCCSGLYPRPAGLHGIPSAASWRLSSSFDHTVTWPVPPDQWKLLKLVSQIVVTGHTLE